MSCETCAALEREIAAFRVQLADAGRDQVVRTVDDNDPELDRELERFMQSRPDPSDAAAAYRAGWVRMSRSATPRLRECERLWWAAIREGDQLRARVGNLLREMSRLSDG